MEYILIGGVLAAGYYLSNRDEGFENNTIKGQRRPVTAYTSLSTGGFKDRTNNSPFVTRPATDIGEDLGAKVDFFGKRGRNEGIIDAKYHTNMFPFFGSTIKQNTDPNANKQILDFMTGAGSVDIGKRENEQLFNREEKNIGNPFGTPNRLEEQREHYVVPNLRNNELPFEQVWSGPGLDDGYTNIPSGGVQQDRTRDAALRRYKTVDELRPLSDPKITYGGVMMNPEIHIKQMGEIGLMEHRSPDRFYINKDGERNLITTGAYIKPRVMPEPVDRAVNRPSTTREYFGVAGSPDAEASYQRALHKESHRMGLGELNMGPAHYVVPGAGQENATDFGKDGFSALPNQRTITGTRTTLGPAHGGMYSGPNQYPDEARFGKKMYFEGNPREFGQLQYTLPQNLPAKDPTDIARPTIREQTEDLNWVAPAKIDVPMERSQVAERNMKQNRNKEKISKGREPTQKKENLPAGKDKVHIKTRKIESDYFNQYPRTPIRTKETTSNRSTFGNTKLRPVQGANINVERNDLAYLKPLHDNPYVISVAWKQK
jgi:hypothetical protein